MADYGRVLQQDVEIPAEHTQAAIQLLRETYPRIAAEHPDDANFVEAVATYDDRWYANIDQDGAIAASVPREYRGYGIGTGWIDTVAQYVKDGAFVEWLNPDHELCRYVWCDGKEARVVHPEWPRPTDEEV